MNKEKKTMNHGSKNENKNSNDDHVPSTVIQMKSNVDVYSLEDKVLLFRHGSQVLRFDVPSLGSTKIKELISMLDQGIPTKVFQKKLEMDDEEVFRDFLQVLSNRGIAFVEEKHDSHRNQPAIHNCLETLNGYGYYSRRKFADVCRIFTVNIIGPDCFTDALGQMLEKYGISYHKTNYTFEKKKFYVEISKKEDPFELHILYLGGIDSQYRKDLAYELGCKKINYLPIYKDGDYPWIIGPLYKDGGCCMECYESRRRANMSSPEVMRLIASDSASHIKQGHPSLTPISLGLLTSTASICCLNYIVGVDCEFESRVTTVFELDERLPAINHVRLYKNPYCQACSPRLVTPATREFSMRS